MGSRNFYYPGRNKELHLRKYSTPASVNIMYFNAFFKSRHKKTPIQKMILLFRGDQALNFAGLPILRFHAIL